MEGFIKHYHVIDWFGINYTRYGISYYSGEANERLETKMEIGIDWEHSS